MSARSADYAEGQTLAPMPELRLTDARWTAIAVISPTCRFCRDSLPVYRELAKEARRSGRTFRLAFVTTADPAETARMLNSEGLASETLVVKPASLRASAVPLLLLADSTGMLKGVWTGRLDAESGAAVRERVQALASS